ncbi:MAG: class I SAM-dependent methyltransferase [Baekduia sp.]
MPGPAVYGSSDARLRGRILSMLAGRTRAARHHRFFELLELADDARILDVGCGRLGLRAFEPGRYITGVDMLAIDDYPGPFVQADVLAGLPFEDGEFDLVHCSSVIEHVAPEHRAAFVGELRRVGRRLFLQTPAYSFPIEPHAALPFAHWLPPGIRRRYWKLGVQGVWEDLRLMRRREVEGLTGVDPKAERVGPFVKSWVSIDPSPGVQRPQVGAAALD